MIKGFADKETERLFHGRFAYGFPTDIQRTAQRKLRQIHAAEALSDLSVPPGNRLEALKGDRAGQHSRRVNDKWRICFV
jgi:proteic killer suppression protein